MSSTFSALVFVLLAHTHAHAHALTHERTHARTYICTNAHAHICTPATPSQFFIGHGYENIFPSIEIAKFIGKVRGKIEREREREIAGE